MDKELRKIEALDLGTDGSGSTAVCAIITPMHIVIANCGDSRAVLFAGQECKFATIDHKPTMSAERARIIAAGGSVVGDRVCGDLAVSRSLGDFSFKNVPSLPDEQQKVSAEADISTVERVPDHTVLTLACDGIWDVVTNDEFGRMLHMFSEGQMQLHEICESILDKCLALGSHDNMTLILIELNKQQRKISWC